MQPFQPIISPAQTVQTYLNRVQTASGKLTVSSAAVTLEHPGFGRRTDVLPLDAITNVSGSVTVPRTFGRFGGAMRFVFTGASGQRIQANSVPWDQAMALCDLFRIPRP